MDNLPEIKEQDGRRVVSARELYLALGFEDSNWAKWYHKNITKSPFAIQNQDWVVFVLSTKTPNGRPTRDFALSIDFAKRLSMMARTQKGEEVRQYFIRCEKVIQEIMPANDDLIIQKAVGILQQRTATLEATVLQQQKTIEQQAPKVEYVETVLASESLITTTTIAKELGTSAYALNKFLYQQHIVYPHDGHWVLYAQYQSRGYTKTRTHSYVDGSGELRTSIQTVWTEKGRMFIHNKMKQIKGQG